MHPAQCETLGRELVAAKQAKERSEQELRQQVRGVCVRECGNIMLSLF